MGQLITACLQDIKSFIRSISRSRLFSKCDLLHSSVRHCATLQHDNVPQNKPPASLSYAAIMTGTTLTGPTQDQEAGKKHWRHSSFLPFLPYTADQRSTAHMLECHH